jgi:ribonuclease D
MIKDDVAVVKSDIDSELLALLREYKKVAWDIETSGLDWRTERIGVCQLYTPRSGTIVVQLGSRRPTNLCKLLEDPNVTKVFHHAPFDLRFMHHHWQVRSRNIADTKIASKLLSPDLPNEEHSLQELLDRYLAVSIGKEEQTSNWLVKHLIGLCQVGGWWIGCVGPVPIRSQHKGAGCGWPHSRRTGQDPWTAGSLRRRHLCLVAA